MALICPINRGIVPLPRRSYITTGTFHTDIFKYTTALSSSYVTVGTLTTLDALGTGTASNCPGNRVLRENGRVLNPDANPVSTLVKSGSSAAFTLQAVLVGVYDAISGLSGFIDPNSSKFQLYNGSRTNFAPDGVNPVSGVKDNLGQNTLVTTPLTPSTSATTAAVAIDASTGKVFKLTLSSTMLNAITFTITTSTVPIAGTTVVLVFNSGPQVSFTKTLSFTTGFSDEGALVIPSAAAAANFVFTFVSDGTTLFEISRNVGLLATGATVSGFVGVQADGTV